MSNYQITREEISKLNYIDAYLELFFLDGILGVRESRAGQFC